MKQHEFASWLATACDHKASTCRSRVANCRRVEDHEGDLDEHFRADGLRGLLERLKYSTADEAAGAAVRHRVPIDGNCNHGTATLRSAVRLYQRFCEARAGNPRVPTGALASDAPTAVEQTTASEWPRWDMPPDRDVLTLAGIVACYARFLEPNIIAAVVEDNEKHREEWCSRLRAREVNSDLYMWPRSACVFPGVRRYAGTKEITAFRARTGERFAQALRLDDNTYPRHLWSYVFRGRRFQNFGPDGYALAHLVDHKVHKNRNATELGGETRGNARYTAFFGLFTSATNSVYLPTSLIRPTDFASPLRNLLLRRTVQLYGSFCELLPAGLLIPECACADWKLDAFDWCAPVGTVNNISRFLAFRAEVMGKLLETDEPA